MGLKKNPTQLTHHKGPTQPNSIQPTWIKLDPWVGQFFLITIIIIIWALE